MMSDSNSFIAGHVFSPGLILTKLENTEPTFPLVLKLVLDQTTKIMVDTPD